MPELPAVKRFLSDSGVRIYRIPYTFMFNLSGRVYLMLEAGPPTLVDAGSGQDVATRDIIAGLDSVRSQFGEKIRLGDVKRFLITHGHIDHVGGLWQLTRQATAQVVAHPLDRRRVAALEEQAVLADRALLRFLRQAGVPIRQQAEPAPAL